MSMTLLYLAVSFLPAQEGALDVLDGETLYEQGLLLTAGYEMVTKRGLLDGDDRRGDPLQQRQFDLAGVLSAHYGALHNLQVGTILPFVHRFLTLDDPVGPDRFSSGGMGDVTVYAKWRYLRLEEVGVATNFALLAGFELPTGSDDEQDHGLLLPAELQPGSASWDPFVGTAVTHEPGRWRFNAMALYKRVGQGTHHYKQGDQFFAELAAGNRFWLEPYPGPFMRADLVLRYRREQADRRSGGTVSGTGGDLLTVGLNWAFRPRPTLDLQLALEYPVYESLRGTQLKESLSFFLAFGVRL